ncbi:hypothetical protein OESDEN_12019 [Oesophagostomum dentatum]|uniref:Uncharacterized protein n=1 Tax=Oesophagostomum dentatum TaxID=61180 RepID=A0A0B1SYG0_OESDE|nr:hypothetical protein OESDEN_12019 [Oesophagostomum dentatum]
MSDSYNDFRMRNKNWMDERLKCADMCKQIIVGKKRVEDLNRIRPFNSVYHLASELHEVAPAIGHSVFLCRALKDLTLSMEPNETIANEGTTPLLVRPTRYEYGPSAVSTYDQNSGYVKIFQTRLLRDVKVSNQIKKKLNALRKLCDQLDSEDVLRLQLIDYVYNETLKMLPESEKDPYEGLAINNAWKTLIDNNVLKKESKEALKTMFSSHHSWINACSVSQKNIIPRCDQLPHEGITEAEYSSVSIPWMVLCAGICLVCAILIALMVAD